MFRDHTESNEIICNMQEAVEKMLEMAADVGSSKQVEKFTSKRLDNLLSKYVDKTPAVDARGKSNPMSTREHLARIMPAYQAEFEEIAKQHREALIIIQRYDAQERRYEASRSVLSFSKSVPS